MIIARRCPVRRPRYDEEAVNKARANFCGTLLANLREAAQVDHVNGDEKNHRAEDALGKVLQRFGEKEQDEGDGGGGDDLSDLALTAGAFDHGGLCGAAIDDEASAEGCSGIRG